MKIEDRDKWVAALRSGDYEQTTGKLVEAGKYCCLGVLCDVLRPDEWDEDEDGHIHPFAFRDIELKPHVALRLGISPSDHARLIEMNDKLGFSFRMIADEIEMHWPEASRAA